MDASAPADSPLPSLEQQAQALREALLATPAPALAGGAGAGGSGGAAAIAQARALLRTLRDERAYTALVALADAVLRQQPLDHASRRLYAQGLIELGAVGAALALLQEAARTMPAADPEWAEVWGLVGRCHKQVFVEAAGRPGQPLPAQARGALRDSAAAYARPYAADPQRHLWHGINLLSLAWRAAQVGEPLADTAGLDVQPAALADALLPELLAQVAQAPEDPWLLASLAEVALGRVLMASARAQAQAAGPASAAAAAAAAGDAAQAAYWVQAYVQHPRVTAFMIASTLRQFTTVWGVGAAAGPLQPIVAGLLDVMRARLLQLPGGALAVPPRLLQRAAAEAAAATGAESGGQAVGAGELEALLSSANAKSLQWWRAGLQAATAVAVVRQRVANKRLGTGFLVRAGALGLQRDPDELLLLTNFHVVNREGSDRALRPDQAEVLFEAAEPGRVHTVAAVLWQSPVDEHDAALLRLAPPPAGIAPLLLAPVLPPRPAPDTRDEDKPRVYIIGHPGGREIAVSMTDNALIDHEAPPEGTPLRPDVWRVHYRAPTEGGNSGSPVFNDEDWSVIALHHKGGRFGMPRLNGGEGTYAANEGLALPAIAAAVRRALEPDG